MQIKEYNEISKLSESAACHIHELIKTTLERQGFFAMALSGGASPLDIYTRLAEKKFSADIPWEKVFFFWGDERYIPFIHRDSNYGMAYKALLSKIPVPAENVFRVPVEVTPIDEAAELYERIMRKFFTSMHSINMETMLPEFDLVLLGVGTDGHTASLFPGHRAVNEDEKWVTSLKAHARVTIRERITITLPVINSAKNIMFLISGQGKGPVIRSIFENKDSTQYPASMVQSKGQSIWYIDKNIY